MAKNKRRKVKDYRRSFYSCGIGAPGRGHWRVGWRRRVLHGWRRPTAGLGYPDTWYTVAGPVRILPSEREPDREAQAASDAASSVAQSQPEQEAERQKKPAAPTAVVEGPGQCSSCRR